MPYWQRFPSPNFDVPALPHFEGATNIQPFTYRDGATFLEMIDDLRKWCDDALTEPVNAKLQEYLTHLRSFAEGWAGQLATHRSEVVALTEEMRETINDAFKIFDGINTKTGSLPIQDISGDDIIIRPQNTWPRGWPVILRVKSTTGRIGFEPIYFNLAPIPRYKPNEEVIFVLLPYGEQYWRVLAPHDDVARITLSMFGHTKDDFIRAIDYAHASNRELLITSDVNLGDDILNISKPIVIDGGGKKISVGAVGGFSVSAGATIKNLTVEIAGHRSSDAPLFTLSNAHNATISDILVNTKYVGSSFTTAPSFADIGVSRDITFRHIRGRLGGYFVFAVNATNLTVDKCEVDCTGGVIVNGSANNIRINDTKLGYYENAAYRGERHGFRTNGDSSNIRITGGEIWFFPAGGFVMDGGYRYDDIEINRVSFRGNKESAISISARNSDDLSRVTIAGCGFYGAARTGRDNNGIECKNVGALRIDDCSFPEPQHSLVMDYAIKLVNCPKARIRGCDIHNPRTVGIDISGRSFSCRVSDCVILANHADTISAIRLAPLTILGTVVQGCTLTSTAGVLSFHGDRTPGNMPPGINTMYFGALVYAGTFLRDSTDAEMAKVHFDISYIDVWPNEMQPPRKALPGSTYRNGSGIYVFVNDAWRKVNS